MIYQRAFLLLVVAAVLLLYIGLLTHLLTEEVQAVIVLELRKVE